MIAIAVINKGGTTAFRPFRMKSRFFFIENTSYVTIVSQLPIEHYSRKEKKIAKKATKEENNKKTASFLTHTILRKLLPQGILEN